MDEQDFRRFGLWFCDPLKFVLNAAVALKGFWECFHVGCDRLVLCTRTLSVPTQLSTVGGDMHQTTDTHKQRGRNRLRWQLGYVCWSSLQLGVSLHRCGTHGVHFITVHGFLFIVWRHQRWPSRRLSNVARRMKGKYSEPEQLCSHQSNELDFGVRAGAPRLKTPRSTSTERDVL